MFYPNPNKYLRTAYVQGLPAYVEDIPVYSKRLPKDTSTASQYIIIRSQTKNQTAIGKDCFEWLCEIIVDCIYSGVAGFSAPVNNDDLEENVQSFVLSGVTMDGWQVKSNDFINSIDLDADTPTQHIERRVLTFQHWINYNGTPDDSETE